jgi:2-polyprenyl-3-methyl-5-hydroxy-6-metoxy-1,4-benzoquinol methylase
MSSPADLLQHRANAAGMSGGISSDAIYSAIERAIIENSLSGKILDYGAGVGLLTRRLLALGRFERVAAADIIPPPDDLADAVDWTKQDLNAPLHHENGRFEVVVAAEVIEHLENARFTMREISRVLRPGGTAIITTPNNESWRAVMALIIRGHFVAFSDSCYPAHITALVRKDFVRAMEEAGFSEPQFCFTNQGGIPSWPAITWQQISLGLLRGLRFSDNILAVARKQVQCSTLT